MYHKKKKSCRSGLIAFLKQKASLNMGFSFIDDLTRCAKKIKHVYCISIFLNFMSE